jgi:excisionase family DNA binding protein
MHAKINRVAKTASWASIKEREDMTVVSEKIKSTVYQDEGLQAQFAPETEEHPGKHAPKVLTVKEAARALRVSKWTVYQLIRTGQLTTFKIGRSRRVPAAAVHDLIAQLSAEEAA